MGEEVEEVRLGRGRDTGGGDLSVGFDARVVEGGGLLDEKRSRAGSGEEGAENVDNERGFEVPGCGCGREVEDVLDGCAEH